MPIEETQEEQIDQVVVDETTRLNTEIAQMRQFVADLYHTMTIGQPPPAMPQYIAEITPTAFYQAQAQSDPQYPPGFSPTQIAGTSTVRPTYTIRPPAPQPQMTRPPIVIIPGGSRPTMNRSDGDPQMQARDQPQNDSYDHGYHRESQAGAEQHVRMEENEVLRRMQTLEQAFIKIQGYGDHSNISYKELCLFPDVPLPRGFITPKFEMYNGQGDPRVHLKTYCNKMRGAGRDELLIAFFAESLTGIAAEWFIRQDAAKWKTWDDLAKSFLDHFSFNIEVIPDRASLDAIRKKPSESYGEYVFRWREQAARVSPPLSDVEIVKTFIEAQEETYYSSMLAALGKPFGEVVKMGEMVERGIRAGKIISPAALRATTQAVQSGTANFSKKKEKKEDVAAVGQVSKNWNDMRPQKAPFFIQTPQPPYHAPQYPPPPNQQYIPSQQGPQYFPQQPIQQYFPAQPQPQFIQNPAYQQWRAPPPPMAQNQPIVQQNQFLPPQNVNRPRGEPGFRPRGENKRPWEPRKDQFTDIHMKYTSLIEKLFETEMLKSIPPKVLTGKEDPSRICAYHSGAPGHDTEFCWDLKRAVQALIDEGKIQFDPTGDQSVNQNPLPVHNDTNTMGMVGTEEEMKQKFSKLILGIGSSSHNKKNVPLIIITDKGPRTFVDKDKSPLKGNQVLIIPIPKVEEKKIEGNALIIQTNSIQKESVKPSDSIIIKPVTQLPITNIKAVPWNYEKVVISYKGKEVMEVNDEINGLTRSGRCFTPEELMKSKPMQNDKGPIKEPVSEKEAEEFLKKMKVHDYSIVEQLRKTPSQISLLNLLMNSEVHRNALLKILNEAHVPEKITVANLEAIAGRVFEINRVSFTDDELPVEGTGHNKALHVSVKCEDSYVTRVLIDGGAGLNICPLATLKSLKVDLGKIRASSSCVRAFDGGVRESLGIINLDLTIGPATFTVEFQVLETDTSYNFLLGRPWIHSACAVPSTVHQVVKFSWNNQAIVVHGENDLAFVANLEVPVLDVVNHCTSLMYETSEIVYIEKIDEGEPIPVPKLSNAIIAMASEIIKSGFQPGKGLGLNLQGRTNPVELFGIQGTWGLGYKPKPGERKKATKKKLENWSLPKPIPCLAQSFVGHMRATNAAFADVITMKKNADVFSDLKYMFEVNMVQPEEGSSNASIQYIGPDVQLTNWKATPLPIRK